MSKGDLTTAEVAERLKVSVITVRQWCRRGLFPKAYEHDTPRGAVWMIPARDLLNFNAPKPGRPAQKDIKESPKQKVTKRASVKGSR